MPVSFAHTREIVEESKLNVYGKAYFCRVTSVLQMGLSPSLNLTHERRHVSGGSAKVIHSRISMKIIFPLRLE